MRISPTIFPKRTRGVVFTRLTLFWMLLFAGVSVSLLGSFRSASSHSARAAHSRVNSERQLGRRLDAQAASAAHVALAVTQPLTPLLPVDVDRTDDAASASLCTPAPNDCSLRGAVTFANTIPGTTINLPAGTYSLTISGAGEGFSGNNSIGDLDIRGNNTSIVGAGAATTIIQQTVTARVVEVNPFLDSGFNFSISGVTVSGGQENSGVGGGGIISGAINNTTTITDSIISGNSATGAGTFGGGGLCNTGGSVNISGTTFSGNSTSGSGGGISYSAGDLLRNGSTGTLTVGGTSFSGNTANSASAGGGAIDVFNFNLGTTSATIGTSSFSNNNAANGRGGAVILESGSADVHYSRLVGNTAATGGRAVHRVSGTLSADNDWWGLNSGPAANANSGGSILVWLQLRAAADPTDACSGTTVNMSADIYGTSGPSAVPNCPGVSCPLNGLPAFSGTVGSTSTQYVNGAATGSFVAGSGNPTATADSETVTATFTLDNGPTTSNPSSTTVCEGATASFTVAVTGSPSIQWQVSTNGGGSFSDLAGETANSLSFTASASQNGNQYHAVVTNSCGTATSNAATLTVQQTTATTDPADQAVNQGGTASFSTMASGAGPFSFVWKKGATVLNNGDLGGRVTITTTSNTSTLAISNVQATDAGSYTVETTGACGTATQSANLTINTAGVTAVGPANVWIGLKNSDDVGTKFDLLAEVFKDNVLIGSGQLNDVPGGSSGFNNAIQDTINMALTGAGDLSTGTLSFRLSVRIAASSGHVGGTARLWYNDAAANSRFNITTGSGTRTYYLRAGFVLATTPGPGPKSTSDVTVNRNQGGNPFKPFGTWSITF